MNREILIQYANMKEEIKDLRRRIKNLERQIDKIEKEGTVKDTVSGGFGGIQYFVIEGFPSVEHSRKVRLLKRNKQKLEQKENDLLELTNAAEEFIDSIEQSDLRMMFRYYYIDGMTWARVAMQMNQRFPKKRIAYTDESCRKRHNRFFENNN